MELRLRKTGSEFENGKSKSIDLQSLTNSLKKLLDKSRNREKRLIGLLEKHGIEYTLDLESGNPIEFESDNVGDDSNLSFISSLKDRGGWLIGLLIFQSCSSFILSSNNVLLNKHPAIVYFLTMLVGSGGNAGNQAAVRVIRGLACNTLNSSNLRNFLSREIYMAISLSCLLGFIGFIRALLSFEATLNETIAITTALCIIVFISIIAGAILPLSLNYFKIDPAHASTSIQVIMDISGVLITCLVASMVLNRVDDNFSK